MPGSYDPPKLGGGQSFTRGPLCFLTYSGQALEPSSHHPQMLSTQTTPDQSSWPGLNLVQTHTSRIGLRPAWPLGNWRGPRDVRLVQASHCFLQVFMSAVLATAFLNWPQSQRIDSQMWYSLVTKNSGLVYREDKGETAWLQNTLLR